jgi:hypothetical protein
MNNDPYFEAHSPAAISPERVTNVYEVKLAGNQQRRGTVQSAEGLARRIPALEQNFAGGFTDARAASGPYFPAKIADGRSRLADGISDTDAPTWVSARDPEINFNFAHGTSAEMRLGNIPPLSARSSISQVGTDLSRLDLSERGRVTYGKTYGSDLKQVRHNEAEVID